MPPEITAVTAILQLIISGATVVTLIYTLTKFLHAPEQTQDSRIAVCESEIKDIKRRLRDGNSHFASLDDGSTITQQCILAMMDAQISGDNIAEIDWIYNRILTLMKNLIKNSQDPEAVEIRNLLKTLGENQWTS